SGGGEDGEVSGGAEVGGHLQRPVGLRVRLWGLFPGAGAAGGAGVGVVGEQTVLGGACGDVEGGQFGRDEGEVEGAFATDPVGGRDGVGPALEQFRHLFSRAQVGAAGGGQVGGVGLQRVACTEGGHDRGQAGVPGTGAVGGGGGDDDEARLLRQPRQRVAALGVLGDAVAGQFHDHPVPPEELDELVQCRAGRRGVVAARGRAVPLQGTSDPAVAAAGEDVPV